MQLTINLPDRTEQLARNRERWAEVLADPRWNDWPGRIETNAFGQIIITPHAGGPHSAVQGKIAFEIDRQLTGQATVVCPVSTIDGVKCIDAGWFTTERYQSVRGQILCEIAPEICVEVISPNNTDAELQHKRALYFDAGAIECWQCDEQGRMSYYFIDAPNTATEQSKLCPQFPATIED